MQITKKTKILIIFGTRPEAIKMAPLIGELSRKNCFDVKVCVTGQHREMLEQVLRTFEIKPDYDLAIMKKATNLNEIVASVLTNLKEIIKKEIPQLILVHGDTATTVAASLAGYYDKIDVGHVEAGLRTSDIYSPWPEEVNRRIVATLAKFNFAPTIRSAKNLMREGCDPNTIFTVGNTVIDALFKIRDRIETDLELKKVLEGKFSWIDKNKKIILVTGHRRENHGEGFQKICLALKELVNTNKELQVIYPVHLNPSVRETVEALLTNIDRVNLIEPLEYVPFIYLMMKSDLILTDSGGIQEEAPSLGKPVFVMRNTTERQEAVDAGTVKLIGVETQDIVQNVLNIFANNKEYQRMSKAVNPYGSGHSCEMIASILEKHYAV